MSLPLTRRIARAALLIGAVAAPLVGAGAASAAEPPQVGDLGGLSSLDKPAGLGHAVEGVTREAGTMKSVQKALPDAGRTLTGTARKTAGTVRGAAGPLARTAKGVDAAELPVGASLPVTSNLPVNRLPLSGGLPLGN